MSVKHLRSERQRPTFKQALELFSTMPGKIAVCEVKYPNARSLSVGTQYFPVSVVIQKVMDELEQFPQQDVIFSSFNPQLALALCWAQNKHPVMYLNCGAGVAEEDEEVDFGLQCNLRFEDGAQWEIGRASCRERV